ncbi:MFS transporter [uncultured Microscilla sp.]|uniref:MFS transporter n=1 Tax=uncultured Microscilla sp. TaxID=432653 RepID=UPI0026127379|nr:MFS transporter [uncultured Microscilla sp.]
MNSLRNFLIWMTMVAVVSDYLLHPFYPQFFEARFGVTNPKMVGYYFAAICFMVMLAFPFWAYVSKRVAELRILVYTQLVAGILALYCFYTTSLQVFWIASLTMVCFKGSYLLVYPFILRIIKPEAHTRTIGILSVVVHLGGILGAVIGGLVVDMVNPAYIFLVMAAGDFIQMGMSIYLLKSPRFNIELPTPDGGEDTPKNSPLVPKGFVLKIGLITLVLYFADFIIRPFFARYWEAISGTGSQLVSGFMYAIPGFVAVFALWWSRKHAGDQGNDYQRIAVALVLGMAGLFLQVAPWVPVVVMGRILYGWAIFQGMVRFDALLFQLSNPESYAVDYSKIHFFQNLGVLLASFSVGIVVDTQGLQMPFWIALVGFGVSLVAFALFFLYSRESRVRSPESGVGS